MDFIVQGCEDAMGWVIQQVDYSIISTQPSSMVYIFPPDFLSTTSKIKI